jgi:putative transposase
MRVSRSGFYDWKDREPDERRLALCDRVLAIHERTRGSYGSRRMAAELRRQGFAVGRYQARCLMREAGVAVRQRRRWVATTVREERDPVAPNLLARAFEVAKPNTCWVADITAIWSAEGWLYLAAVLDLHSREVVGWAMDAQMPTALTLRALEMAVQRRRPAAGLLHHSDRGSQYTAKAYQQRLVEFGMRASMSRKGNCWDNAVMERFFGTLKSEWTDGQHYQTRDDARKDVIAFIEMEYNSSRLHSYLGYRSPREVCLPIAA